MTQTGKLITVLTVLAWGMLILNSAYAIENENFGGPYYFYGDMPKGKNWVQLTGEIERIFSETMTLNAGGKTVKVDVDNLDIDDMRDLFETGDEIMVIGELDEDGFSAEIEAWRIHAVTDYGNIVLGR